MAIQRTHPRVVIRRFGPVRIWRDELHELVGVIRQVHPVSVLEVDEYTCDQVDDLADLEELRVSRFALTSEDGLVSLLLDRDAAQVSAVEPDLATLGMLGEVERIAKRHKRRWRGPGPTAAPASVATAVGLVVGAAVAMAGVGDPVDTFLRSPILFLGIVIVGLAASLGMLALTEGLGWTAGTMAILYTRTRADAPTWLRRNRDALITNVIVSAVFFGIGLAVGQAG